MRAASRAVSPTLAPSLYAVSFTAEIMPCVSVDSPSPIHAESAATVAAAIPSESRRGRQAAPARSTPKPASLKSDAGTAYVLHPSRDEYAVPSSVPQKAVCYGIGIPTAAELTLVNNHLPLIFFASPLRYTWLLAVQDGWPVAGSNDTSK